MNAFEAVENHVRSIDEKLSATEFTHDRWVLIKHEEGTQLFFRAAFLRHYRFDATNLVVYDDIDGQFIGVFTEHHRFHVFAKDELESFHQFKILMGNQEEFDELGKELRASLNASLCASFWNSLRSDNER